MVLITFKFYAKSTEIRVQAEADEKFGEVIINNESKIGLNLRNKKYKFFYNNYELKLNSSKTLLELGLNKNPIIIIYDLDIIKPSESSNIPIVFNFEGEKVRLYCGENEKIDDIFNRFLSLIGGNPSDYEFCCRGCEFLCWGKTLKELGLRNFSFFDVYPVNDFTAGGGPWFKKEINIKFIKISENINGDNISNSELIGLLKLCFLKELSSKLSYNQIMKLPELTYYLMRIIKKWVY